MTRIPQLPALRKRRPAPGLAAERMHRNVVRTSSGEMWAWYRLGPHPWSLRSLRERETVRADQARAWADLVGHDVHLRITSVPYPRARWAEGLDKRTPNHLPNRPGGMTWQQWLLAQQDRIATTRLSVPFRAVGVRLNMTVNDAMWEQWTTPRHDAAHPLARELKTLTATMAAFTPRPDVALTSQEMWWLMHRSVGLGHSPPSSGFGGGEVWHPGHMGEFSDPVTAYAEPMAPTVTIRAVRDGKNMERFIAIRSLIRIDNGARTNVTQNQPPWLAAVDQFPFPVEVSARFSVIDGRDLTHTMETKQQRAIHIGRHARESDRIEQLDVHDTVAHATQARQEVEHGSPEVATRLHGTIRLAVSGLTAEQALDRAADVERYFSKKQGMQAVGRRAQWAQYREFVPAEPSRLMRGDVERLGNEIWSTAWPGASSQVGDGVGVYTAATFGLGRRAVMVEPHAPIFRGGRGQTEQPANTIIVGTLGSGKTYLAGFLIACAAYRGDLVVASDPDGWLARLADVPELRDDTRLIQLTGSNEQHGLLNPWNLIPDPRGDDQKAMSARKQARVERKQLAHETFMAFVHPRMQAGNRHIQAIISDAVTQVGSEVGSDPWLVLRWLDDKGHDEIARELRANIDSPQGLLVFGEPGNPTNQRPLGEHHGLTIITSPGLQSPPPAKPQQEWTPVEQLSVPVRSLTQFLVTSILRGADRDAPKHLWFDEVGVAAQSPSVVGHLQTVLRTSRGNTTAVGLISQDAGDILRLGVGNWLSRKWLGRAASIEDARIGLSLPPTLAADAGYEESVLPNLSRERPGEFVYADEAGQAEKVRVDAGWWPNVHTALGRVRPVIEEAEWHAGAAA